MLKMVYPSSQLSITDLQPASESAQFFPNRLKRLDISLLAETVLVTTAALLAIKLFDSSSASGNSWFLTPGILVAAALIPTAIKKNKCSDIGLAIREIRHCLAVLGWTCLVVFPAAFCGLWLLKFCGLDLPLRPVLPQNQEWVGWLFYQFMYVAVAEEVFFRGYLQSNVMRLTKTVTGGRSTLWQWTSVGVSAACFAVAHIIIYGRIISVLTFLPGLVLGWLFIRTKSLLAPILFHGLANTCYFFAAAMLA